MSDTKRTETILIREGALLPAGLAVESEMFLPGWRAIKNLDRSTLARNIEGENWSFFYLAGEIRATVLGRDRSGTLRRVPDRSRPRTVALISRSEEHTSELQSPDHLVCRLLLEKKKREANTPTNKS